MWHTKRNSIDCRHGNPLQGKQVQENDCIDVSMVFRSGFNLGVDIIIQSK